MESGTGMEYVPDRGSGWPSVKRRSCANACIHSIIRAYKSAVAYATNAVENQRGALLWQKNYYEHVIRNDDELNNIGWYIINNLLNWQSDRDNPQNTRKLSAPEQVDEYVKDVEEMVLRKADHE
jgi:hypothetical protein